jgi:xanthine dehydrogenase accessory factor
MANIRRILMLETRRPLAVRREVSFCEAVYAGRKRVEGVEALRVDGAKGIHGAWSLGEIAVMVDPIWSSISVIRPDVLIDAILAKNNIGTSMNEAPLVIALGPGFLAGRDAHMVIETNRGHDLGRILDTGEAEPDTGMPGTIDNLGMERVLRAPEDGLFKTNRGIGDRVKAGDLVAEVGGSKINAEIDGVIRGLLRTETEVTKDLKLGDIDPRSDARYCSTISDKARAIAGSALEAVLRVYNA